MIESALLPQRVILASHSLSPVHPHEDDFAILIIRGVLANGISGLPKLKEATSGFSHIVSGCFLLSAIVRRTVRKYQQPSSHALSLSVLLPVAVLVSVVSAVVICILRIYTTPPTLSIFILTYLDECL